MTNSIALSNRLQKIAAYLPEGASFADIGSDHAYLPCFVCLHDQQARAIAGEVNNGPYQSAKETVKKYHLEKQIDVRLGDGLSILNEKDNVQQIVIAGMGGSLISQILDKGESKLVQIDRIIAQPNVDAREVRKWFNRHQYEITEEEIMEENGHIYEIIIADKIRSDSKQLSEREAIFGPILLEKKTSIFVDKWRFEYNKQKRIINQMKQAKVQDKKKIELFEKELQMIWEELKEFE